MRGLTRTSAAQPLPRPLTQSVSFLTAEVEAIQAPGDLRALAGEYRLAAHHLTHNLIADAGSSTAEAAAAFYIALACRAEHRAAQMSGAAVIRTLPFGRLRA